MRYRMLYVIVVLALQVPLWAQDSEFPTLAELANVEIPAYEYDDTARRFSGIRGRHRVPSSPPDYTIGAREFMWIPGGESGEHSKVQLELRGMTENVLIWVKEPANYSHYQAQAMAERVENSILPPLRQLFNYVEPPGVDGDQRVTIVMVHDTPWSSSGVFTRVDTHPRSLYADSNQREMMVVNLAYGDGSYVDDDYVASVIGHEYQHMQHHFQDFGEEHWLNEALSGFASYYVVDSEIVRWNLKKFMEAPDTALTNLRTGESLSAKYGAATLFMIYLASQYGDEIVGRLQAEEADGWYAVDKVLRENAGVSADEVFADWVLANYYQDAQRGFGYSGEDILRTSPQPVANLLAFPTAHSGSLRQFATDYIVVDARGADKLALRLAQAPEAQLINASAYEGDRFYYAVPKDTSSRRLTRRFNLASSQDIWLTFRLWHNLKPHYEYGYVQVSADGGSSWRILPGKFTEDESLYGRFYADGYTGNSRGWLQERIDLSDYAGRSILLRFEVLTDARTFYQGMAIDDIRIDAISFRDGFETADNSWIAEGWIRTDNRLPQLTWLQVVQETDDGLHLNRSLITGSGDLSVDLLPGAGQALVAISPVVPQTAMQTEYELEVNLIDADGDIMAISRECTVRTTHGLNFRDAPNGNKIGLVPQGASVYALDRSGDWFMVEYDGERGWISASYVTTEGNCP